MPTTLKHPGHYTADEFDALTDEEQLAVIAECEEYEARERAAEAERFEAVLGFKNPFAEADTDAMSDEKRIVSASAMASSVSTRRVTCDRPASDCAGPTMAATRCRAESSSYSQSPSAGAPAVGCASPMRHSVSAAPSVATAGVGVRSAITPIVTIFGLDLGILLGGAILTETVFNIPGIGRLAFDAIQKSDLPIVQGTVLIAAFAVIMMNLIVDIVYAFLDPRVRY